MRRRYGLIAGNGRFPLLVIDAAHEQGVEMIVVAIRGETSPEIENHAERTYWLGLGQLGKLIDTLKGEGISEAIMAGQVKHKQIFSSTIPDWHMLKLLSSLPRKNTDSLIGAVAEYLAKEGISLIDSTEFLQPLLAQAGPLTRRVPNDEEAGDVAYGLSVAREIARLDVGQTVVIKDRAVIAVEAMEGTDDTIRRAGRICGQSGLSVVKVSKPEQDMRFDVPVVGPQTLKTMKEAGASALSVDAGRALLLEKTSFLEMANDFGVAVVGQESRR